MAVYLSCMKLKAENQEDYRILRNWCSIFEKDWNISKIFRKDNASALTVCYDELYDELNFDANDAENAFDGLANYCKNNGISGKVSMLCLTKSLSNGEEQQLLFELENGRAAEWTAIWDLDDDGDYIECIEDMLYEYGHEEECDAFDALVSDYLDGLVEESEVRMAAEQYADMLECEMDDYENERLRYVLLPQEEQDRMRAEWEDNPNFHDPHEFLI